MGLEGLEPPTSWFVATRSNPTKLQALIKPPGSNTNITITTLTSNNNLIWFPYNQNNTTYYESKAKSTINRNNFLKHKIANQD